MIQQTSKAANAATGRLQISQCARIFHLIRADYLIGGKGLTAHQVAEQTGIQNNTVHARLNSLFGGYLFDGEVQYVIPSGKIANGKLFNNTYTIGVPENDQRQREAILRDIKRGFKKLRQMETERLREIKGLFDNE